MWTQCTTCPSIRPCCSCTWVIRGTVFSYDNSWSMFPLDCLVQVMIDHEEKKLRLIDWGLAEFYHPGKEYVPALLDSIVLRFIRPPQTTGTTRDCTAQLHELGGSSCKTKLHNPCISFKQGLPLALLQLDGQVHHLSLSSRSVCAHPACVSCEWHL